MVVQRLALLCHSKKVARLTCQSLACTLGKLSVICECRWLFVSLCGTMWLALCATNWCVVHDVTPPLPWKNWNGLKHPHYPECWGSADGWMDNGWMECCHLLCQYNIYEVYKGFCNNRMAWCYPQLDNRDSLKILTLLNWTRWFCFYPTCCVLSYILQSITVYIHRWTQTLFLSNDFLRK